MLTLEHVKSKSENRVRVLHSTVQKATVMLIENCYLKGINILITQGLRTIAEQNELYAQGRTKSGNIVTNAKGGYSNHNFGVAIDFALLLPNGKSVSWDTLRDGNLDSLPDWSQVVDEAKKLGFSWGGDWKSFKDMPHFEMTFGLSTTQYRNGVKPAKVDLEKIETLLHKKNVKEDEKMTKAESEAIAKLFSDLQIKIGTLVTAKEELEKELTGQSKLVNTLEAKVSSLEDSHSMNIPPYAKEAVDALMKLKDKKGNSVINTPEGRSSDFYAVVTVLYRAGLIK